MDYVTYESVDRLWPRMKNLCDHEQEPRRIPHRSWRVDKNDQDIEACLTMLAQGRSTAHNRNMARHPDASMPFATWLDDRNGKGRLKERNDGPTSKSLIRSRSVGTNRHLHHRSWTNWHCHAARSARPTWSTEKPPSPKLPECKRLLRHWPAKRPKYRHENAQVSNKKRILRWSPAVVAPNPLLRNPTD